MAYTNVLYRVVYINYLHIYIITSITNTKRNCKGLNALFTNSMQNIKMPICCVTKTNYVHIKYFPYGIKSNATSYAIFICTKLQI